MTYGNFLGYERGADGNPVIDEAQAGIVRQIYGMFLDGQTPSSIAATLTQQGVPTPAGQNELAEQHGQIHPDQRKVQGRRAAAEDDYRGLSEQGA